MIRYNLICTSDHEFEGWFSNSADYDSQASDGLLCCPICGASKVEKAIMAPAVKTARKSEARDAQAKAMMNTVAAKIRDKIAANCEDVGNGFAEEARAIYYGEKPERGIYGSASPKEVEALAEEGVTAVPLPDMLVPKPEPKKLN